MRTIKTISGRFTCMTTFGRRIAAACDDGTVGVYDSVTGALRLSLSPGDRVRAVRGSPDGSALLCAHQGSLITVWDIQTGGLIHTFVLESRAEDIAIYSGACYLACGLSCGSLGIWEVANKTEVATFGRGSPITHICWLEPGKQLVVTRGASAQVWDVIGQTVLRSFTMQGPIRGVVYAQKLNSFAIVATLGAGSAITVINPYTGALLTNRTSQRISCITFSPITKEIVCGMETPGLELSSVPEQRWRRFGHSATITSVSMLSSGTVVANVAGSGIQLLSLDEGHSSPQQPTISTFNLHTFDEDNIIAILSTSLNHIALLELATMSPLSIIPTQTRTIPTDCSVILCASLKHRIAICRFGDVGLELWRFGDEAPAWTSCAPISQLVGGISPGGSRLVTIQDDGLLSIIRLYRAEDGTRIGELFIGGSQPRNTLEVKFESEDKFYSNYDGYRVPLIISRSASSAHPYSIIRQGQVPLAKQQRYYDVDGAREWVIGSSKRICWIPPGYIGSDKNGYWWAGNALIMCGQDGVLRKLTFRKPF